MYSPNRLGNTFTEERFSRLFRKKEDQEIPKSIGKKRKNAHEEILAKGEEFVNKIFGLDERKIEKVRKNEKIAKCVEEIRDEENRKLQEKIEKLNQEFTRKALRLQKSALGQVEKMKIDLMQTRSKAQINCDSIIGQRANTLINSTIPLNSSMKNTQSALFNSTFSLIQTRNKTFSSMQNIEKNRENIQKLKAKFHQFSY